MWDHPRMRGEHGDISINANDNQGSSPHARGTQPRIPLPQGADGIIPACAGNTAAPGHRFPR